jgi:hypothetical protein
VGWACSASYVYRAVDRDGQVNDVLTSARRRSSAWAVLHFWGHLDLIDHETGQPAAHHPNQVTPSLPITLGFQGRGRPDTEWTIYAWTWPPARG